MTTAMIFTSMLFLGFSCSIGCGSVSSSFVLGTQIGGEDCTVQSCQKAVIEFSMGKILSLSLMGLFSSFFGMIILNQIELLYPNSTVWIVRGFTCLFGVQIFYNLFKKEILAYKEKKLNQVNQAENSTGEQIISPCSSTACSSCSGCPSSGGCGASSEKVKHQMLKGSYFWAGLLYATIPCGPLIATLTYASTMNPFMATLLLASFGVVNSIIPVCLHATLIGQANTELTKETPFLMKPLKAFGGGLLLYVGLFVV